MNVLKWVLSSFSLVCVALCAGCSGSDSALPGYIEGEYTYISSEIDGILLDLPVMRGQPVAKGDLVYRLDPEPEKSSVVVSKANIADLQAQVDFAKKQLDRQKILYPGKAAPLVDLDRAKQDFLSKSQELNANQAQLIKSEWSLQQKTAYAPVSGQVFDTFYRIGETVQANHPVLAILAPVNIKVLFYLPESSLSLVKLGQDIEFTCDGCKERTRAKISYISPEAEYTPPVIYSKDTRNKLVYLIRADMPEVIARNFHPGQPIDVYLHANN